MCNALATIQRMAAGRCWFAGLLAGLLDRSSMRKQGSRRFGLCLAPLEELCSMQPVCTGLQKAAQAPTPWVHGMAKSRVPSPCSNDRLLALTHASRQRGGRLAGASPSASGS